MTGRRYVIYGLTPLVVGVARALHEAKHHVVILHPGPTKEELLSRLPEGIQVQECSSLRSGLKENLAGCDCLLGLNEEDLVNLKVALLAHHLAPAVPVVIRTFDPTMAEALQEGANIRRAYGLSTLAAPAFVSALLAEEVITTLSMAGQQVSLCRLRVEEGSPLIGLDREQLEQQYGCVCVGAFPPALSAGDPLVVGGLETRVLGVAAANHPPPRSTGPTRKPAASPPSLAEVRIRLAFKALVSILVLAFAVFWHTLKLDPIDAIYFVVTTATTTGYGDISLKDAPVWVKLFGCLVMVSGAALAAVLFSHLSVLITRDGLEERMGRRARELRNHVILAGLGRIGYRVEQLLTSLQIPCVVLDQTVSRFTGATQTRAVMLLGDARLPEDLERAGIDQARAIVACTDNDLSNLQCALQARKLNPSIFTVARIIDTELAETLAAAFGIDAVVNPVAVAIGAFVGAATDERALRHVTIDDRDYVAVRHKFTTALNMEQRLQIAAQGIIVVAVEHQGAVVTPGPDTAIAADSWAIVVGPEEAMRPLLALPH